MRGVGASLLALAGLGACRAVLAGLEVSLAGMRKLEALRGPDLGLLNKFADGYGGRRTGELQRLGYLRWRVTPEGLAALERAGRR